MSCRGQHNTKLMFRLLFQKKMKKKIMTFVAQSCVAFRTMFSFLDVTQRILGSAS